ncbi:OmpA family protein [Nafulsella turpanensis]|uniref:OmpA family protein n=1 Tax=Nafulsella turpanensis TaxID=1265690 RepID=UPI00034B0EFD|nr:OmpA family protein [Nafulsella turpanensis]
MTLKNFTGLSLGLFLLASGSACVSQKKYDQLLSEKVRLEAQKHESEEALAVAESTIERLETALKNTKDEADSIRQELRASTENLNAKTQAYIELEEYYNNLVNSSGKLNKDLAEQQQRLLSAREELELARQQNQELSLNLQEREKRVRELEQILEEKEKAVAQLKKRVSDALLNFKENDLTVQVKNGKVYVSLAEQLLFKSGSIAVDPKGVNALKQLAGVLKESPEIQILVEGHTDNVPLGRTSQYMKNNWDLSVLRATSIVDILTDAGVAPDRVTAAGRGEHLPLTTNETAEGRAKNRRTEIILTPKLDELFEILEGN